MIRSVCAVLLLAACQPAFDPPSTPVHDRSEDGFMHARGHETPFLCFNPVSFEREACPSFRPERENLSCDAAGCHGDNDYVEGPHIARSLNGSDGPSCWTCHNQEWSGRVE